MLLPKHENTILDHLPKEQELKNLTREETYELWNEVLLYKAELDVYSTKVLAHYRVVTDKLSGRSTGVETIKRLARELTRRGIDIENLISSISEEKE